ncbi:ABC transporter ATP-binding protein [Microbacterium sp. zg-Y818]|uniref:dipeptide ABC transporter ATP-binding protein n=2 Tax=Microbacterium TaxID=33882 RepID=UPI00214A9ADA|nr:MULTISPECIES: ABC transporter ATP-binding protein [unclassified Microbacterium]MCR2801273.1 ABC transporter ATP-binding protein [Microbacterium sp. zg.Y818]WIM21105.1 ABC transporter ATP-binding protein [Microbacterium sp. zg-Y818]
MTYTDTHPAGADAALRLTDLRVDFAVESGLVRAVKGVSLDLRAGEVVAIVGESGSGKSVSSSAAMGLLPENALVTGSAEVGGTEVVGIAPEKMRAMRATQVAMIFQEPMSALNPVLTVERQMTEVFELHDVAYGADARERSVELLQRVGIPDPETRISQYPHQFSGGQRQRIVIAMAIALNPRVIIADEPTTALDVTVQAEILDLLRSLKDDLDVGILLITHNMGVVADLADRVVVMYKGELVEQGLVTDVLKNPQHPYTRKLLNAVPRLSGSALGAGTAVTETRERERAAATPAERDLVLVAEDLALDYVMRGKAFRAVEGVSFDLGRREVLGVVGESGSGKSTIAKAVLGLLPVASGSLKVRGEDFAKLRGRAAKNVRRHIGAVFQDPASSLNPRFPIGECIIEPMVVHRVGDKRSRQARARELLDAVRLPTDVVNRYPHELSGGQRQRVSIARALALKPELLIADEPTSALDVSVQAAVLEMLRELQREFDFACMLVSHDLAVVDMLADHVLVMKDGHAVEQGETSTVLHDPQDDYTKRLLAASPVPDPVEQRERRLARRALLDSLGDTPDA